MGSVEQHLGGNAVPSTFLHYQLRDLWKSPRGTMARIEAFALVAIFLSFIVVAFGSCRRWSNHWIVQKGFLAAQVLSLSLGIYSIGLMQSSPVKSDMYPIWAVSLLTLFGCVDPVTTYVGLDYKGPLSKMIFQLCLYYGYVLLMSISTMSSGIIKVAIYVLSAVTFIKNFHRSLAFVQQRTTRMHIPNLSFYPEPADLATGGMRLKVHLSGYLPRGTYLITLGRVRWTTSMADIRELQFKELTTNGMTIEEVCLAYSLSHLLQRRFLGFTTSMEMEKKWKEFQWWERNSRDLFFDGKNDRDLITTIDYKRALKVVEIELAFLYEVYFTSNEFLHFYQAKPASFWALASFIAICFLGAVVAVTIPAAGMASGHSNSSATAPASAGTTLVILVSLALLQVVQLIRGWASKWEIVSFASNMARKEYAITYWSSWMRAMLVTRMNNWFDKYLWQDKLGQYSLVDAASAGWFCRSVLAPCYSTLFSSWVGKFGLDYIVLVLCEVLGINTTNTEAGFRLHQDDDVKASIAEFLGQIKSRRIGVEWSAFFVENGLTGLLEDLPYSTTEQPLRIKWEDGTTTDPMVSDAYAFTYRVMVWHIVTWYCEQVEQEQEQAGGGSSRENDKHRRVAIALSKYCAYLVVSVPALLTGPVMETRLGLAVAWLWTARAMKGDRNILEVMTDTDRYERGSEAPWIDDDDIKAFHDKVVQLVKQLRVPLLNKKTTPNPQQQGEGRGSPTSTDHWKVLALVWVQTLLYAAPYGDAQTHMQHLSQGGEFITHLWAMLYHQGIHKWEREEAHQPAAPAAESSREAEERSRSLVEGSSRNPRD